MEWLNFCHHFGINPIALVSEYVWLDPEKHKVHDSQRARKPNIKKSYSKNATISVRVLIPIVELIIKKQGEKTYQNFLKSLGLERSYLCVLNNRINHRCFQEVYYWLQDNKLLKRNKDFFRKLNYSNLKQLFIPTKVYKFGTPKEIKQEILNFMTDLDLSLEFRFEKETLRMKYKEDHEDLEEEVSERFELFKSTLYKTIVIDF